MLSHSEWYIFYLWGKYWHSPPSSFRANDPSGLTAFMLEQWIMQKTDCCITTVEKTAYSIQHQRISGNLIFFWVLRINYIIGPCHFKPLWAFKLIINNRSFRIIAANPSCYFLRNRLKAWPWVWSFSPFSINEIMSFIRFTWVKH